MLHVYASWYNTACCRHCFNRLTLLLYNVPIEGELLSPVKAHKFLADNDALHIRQNVRFASLQFLCVFDRMHAHEYAHVKVEDGAVCVCWLSI